MSERASIREYQDVPVYLDAMGRFQARVPECDERTADTWDALTKRLDLDIKKMERPRTKVAAINFKESEIEEGFVTSFTDSNKPRFNRTEMYRDVYKYTKSDLADYKRLKLAFENAHKNLKTEMRRLQSVLSPVVEADLYPTPEPTC